MTYLLIGATILPIVYFLGFILRRDGRLELIENPLKIFYFIFVFGYMYIYWWQNHILIDYVKLTPVWADILYGVAAFSPVFQRELPN